MAMYFEQFFVYQNRIKIQALQLPFLSFIHYVLYVLFIQQFARCNKEFEVAIVLLSFDPTFECDPLDYKLSFVVLFLLLFYVKGKQQLSKALLWHTSITRQKLFRGLFGGIIANIYHWKQWKGLKWPLNILRTQCDECWKIVNKSWNILGSPFFSNQLHCASFFCFCCKKSWCRMNNYMR